MISTTPGSLARSSVRPKRERLSYIVLHKVKSSSQLASGGSIARVKEAKVAWLNIDAFISLCVCVCACVCVCVTLCWEGMTCCGTCCVLVLFEPARKQLWTSAAHSHRWGPASARKAQAPKTHNNSSFRFRYNSPIPSSAQSLAQLSSQVRRVLGDTQVRAVLY